MSIQQEQLIQGSEAWLALRKTKVTGSDAAVILGVNPWKTPLQLWEEKRGLREPDFQNAAMKRGKELEPVALAHYEKDHEPMQQNVVFHKDIDFMMASLDGINFSGDTILEIKCGKAAVEQAKQGIIPEYYIAQMQHCMSASDAQKCHYYAFDADEVKGYLFEVERDDDYIEKLVLEEAKFFEALESRTPPKMTEKDVIRNYHLENEVFATSEIKCFELYKEVKEIETKLKEAKKRFEDEKKTLIKSMGDYSVEGNIVKMTRYIQHGRVNWEEIPELESVDTNKYRADDTIRYKFTIMKKGKGHEQK